MDKNQYIGLILMFALLAVYFFFFSPEPTVEAPAEVPEVENQMETTTATEEQQPVAIPDSILRAQDSLTYGAFSFAASTQEQENIVENEEYLIVFTNKGGKIKEVTLKNYNDFEGKPFVIMDASKSAIHTGFTHGGKPINLSDLGFTFEKQQGEDTTRVIYKLSNESFEITQTYSIPKTGFQVGYDLQTMGLNGVVDPTDISLIWNHGVNRAEKNLQDSRYNSNIRYYTTSGDYDQLKERSEEFEEETVQTPLRWVSFKQKFFTAGMIADESFKAAYLSTVVDVNDSSTVKNGSIQTVIPYTAFLNGFSSRFYFGPNNYAVLKKVTDEFEENLDMGWGPLPIVNKYLIIPIFHFLENFSSNYGLIILIIVIIVRIILSPLTYKSHMSMAKMRVMKPELDEIKAKHDGDMQKAQQEQMQLYQKVGINPLSGCFPLLLQMPILFSLFFFFPNAVELRQQSFLWATDLSTYDSIINLSFTIPFYGDHVSLFTLLMTVSTILITATNSQMTTVQGPMKTMQYMMPIMFLFVLNSYAAGLTFYYFVSNMVTYGQTLLFRKLIDDDKIKAVLEENRKNNKNRKKSKFQSRLEEAMKASQEQQRQKKKKK